MLSTREASLATSGREAPAELYGPGRAPRACRPRPQPPARRDRWVRPSSWTKLAAVIRSRGRIWRDIIKPSARTSSGAQHTCVQHSPGGRAGPFLDECMQAGARGAFSCGFRRCARIRRSRQLPAVRAWPVEPPSSRRADERALPRGRSSTAIAQSLKSSRSSFSIDVPAETSAKHDRLGVADIPINGSHGIYRI